MALTLGQITADTLCHDRLGGELQHHPSMRHGKAITMAGPDDNCVSHTARTVMLALCTTPRRPVYLVPPPEAPDSETPPALCPTCRQKRTQNLRRQQLVATS
jgi:hypothetical protein